MFRWGHSHIGIRGRYSTNQFTRFRPARHDSYRAAFKFCRSRRSQVEAQASLAAALVGSVTDKAMLRKDRLNVSGELDHRRLAGARHSNQRNGK